MAESGLRAGPYELIHRLAVGGMGEVYVARRTGAGDFEKRSAVKLLLPHLSDEPEFVKRFLDEARLSARMHHPNIVEIFDLGEEQGRPFIAMQLVEGLSLSQLIDLAAKKNEPLPLPIVRLIATGICEALTYAHGLHGAKGEALGIIHRDVNPSNILLSSQGAVLLTDFGIAKAASSSHRTEPGKMRGKVSWMAPEQLRPELSGPVTPKADVYSAALTLYALLAFRNPFRQSSDTATMSAVVSPSRPPPVTTYRSDVDSSMTAALTRALAFEPKDRFATARALRDAFVNGPVATAPQLGDWVRRLGADALGRFDELSGLGTSAAGGTKSISLPDERSVTEPRPRRLRWLVAVGAATMLVSTGFALGLWEMQQPPVAATPREPLLINPPPEPPPAPEPVVEKLPPTPAADPVMVAPEAPDSPRPGPTTRPGRPVRRPPPETNKASPLEVGYLTADAEPWADVLLDGRVIDRTPFARFPVPVGKHQLVFRGPDGREAQRSVTVEAGREAAVRVELPPSR